MGQDQDAVVLAPYTTVMKRLLAVTYLQGVFASALTEDMTEYAFAMLEYADELNPGCEDILCMMAQICYESGRKKDASAYLDKIAEPTEITEKFRKLLFYE